QRNKGFNQIHYFNLAVERDESFAPWVPHTVMFFVNSPFVPVTLDSDNYRLKHGRNYQVHITLVSETDRSN
ncbi:hypothetical protein NPIL_336251, partial [Nephila pilipes]